jgi:hypothetical protein
MWDRRNRRGSPAPSPGRASRCPRSGGVRRSLATQSVSETTWMDTEWVVVKEAISCKNYFKKLFNPPTAAKFFFEFVREILDMIIVYDLESIYKYKFFDFSFERYFFCYGRIRPLSAYRVGYAYTIQCSIFPRPCSP